MANYNLNVHIIPFFDSVKNPLTEDKTSPSVWNNGYDNLTVEVSGDGAGTFVVQGCVNTVDQNGVQLADDDLVWTSLYTLDASTYEHKTQIISKGIYHVDIVGISRIRINATGVSGEISIVGAFSK